MKAWGDSLAVGDKIKMLADPSGAFAKAAGLSKDFPNLGGVRSVRYSMVLDKGVITHLNIEPDGSGLTCTLANDIFNYL